MKINNKIKLVFVVLIFLIFMSWNISNWMINSKYNESSLIVEKIDKLEDKYPNDNEIKQLKEDILFLNNVCFDNKQIGGEEK